MNLGRRIHGIELQMGEILILEGGCEAVYEINKVFWKDR
jgi:hypothetical protein